MKEENNDNLQMDNSKLEQQRKASRERYLNNMTQLASIKDETAKAIEESKPIRNTSWARRAEQAERMSSLSAMVSLIGQGVMASSGVNPGAAPKLIDSEARTKQINKINDDYRYDRNLYTQNKLKESLAQSKIYADLAEKEIDFEKSQQSGEIRKDISQERSSTMESIAQGNNQSKESIAKANSQSRESIAKSSNQSREAIAEQNRQRAVEIEQMKQSGATARQERGHAQKLEQQQQQPSKSYKPMYVISDDTNERTPIYEEEFVELYEIARDNSYLGLYYDAKNESVRSSELRVAIQKAYNKRAEALKKEQESEEKSKE